MLDDGRREGDSGATGERSCGTMPGDWVVIQRNPTSGSGKGRKQLLELVSELKSHGLRVRLFSNRQRMDEWLANSSHADRLRCIVGAGGDGTLGNLLHRHPGRRLTILPLGTENLMAKYLGIKRSAKQLCDIILHGATRTIDLGEANGRRFSIMLSAGFDAEVVHRTDAQRTGNISKFTYLQPIWQALRKYPHPQLRVYVDGEAVPRLARMVVVANVPAYALGMIPATSANPEDGLLDVRLFERGSAFQVIRYATRIAMGSHERLPDVASLTARTIRIESDERVPVQIDGDPAEFTPLEISVLPQGLELMVPGDPLAHQSASRNQHGGT